MCDCATDEIVDSKGKVCQDFGSQRHFGVFWRWVGGKLCVKAGQTNIRGNQS
jgi:hypothetical protein